MEDRYGLKAASECDSIIREYCRGSRPNAKKSLKQIAKQTGSALPRRYLARLIYHEAAGSISPGTVGSGSSMKRIQLLQEAYEHAVEATNLASNSLSCAALRATLAINLLVEESALLNPSNKPAKKGQGISTLEKKCQELRERFRGSIDACKTALEHPNPVMVEPVITMITATHTTCDPCSLLQEKILEWFKNGNWQDIVAEKRSVLTSMQQVLQSCYALLDSTQVPVNSIIKLLQHILRPDGAEQQMLASSRVGSTTAALGAAPATGAQSLQLPTAQLHHAAIGELLRLLRPASGGVPPAAAAADCDPPAAGAAPAADTDLAPLPLSVEKSWDPAVPTASAAAPKTAAGAGTTRGKGRGSKGRSAAAGVAAKKKERTRRERFMDVESFWRSCSPEQRMQLLQVPLAPLLEGVKQESGSEAAEELMEGLVLLREQANTSARYWLCAACDRKFHTASDFSAHLEACHEQLVLIKQPVLQQPPPPPAGMMYRPGQIAAAIAAGVAAAGGASATAAAAAGADAAAAVAAAVAEGGPNSMLAQAAQLQQQQQQQHQAAMSGSSISGQAPLTYVSCSKCQCEVVGMYFSSIQPPLQQQQQQPPQPHSPHQLCLKCYRLVTASVGAAKAEQSYTRITPHAPVLGCSAWSESGSEFISTRDSFSSCDEDDDCSSDNTPDGHEAFVGQLGSNRHSPSKIPQTKAQLTAQQQRQLAWLSAAVNRGMPSVAAQHQQQQPEMQQPAPAPGMFVFSSSKGTGSNNAAVVSSTAAAQTAVSVPAGMQFPALPGSAVATTLCKPLAGGDSLSYELIAELEAVHAARKVFLQGQPIAVAAPFLPAAQAAVLTQRQQQLQQQQQELEQQEQQLQQQERQLQQQLLQLQQTGGEVPAEALPMLASLGAAQQQQQQPEQAPGFSSGGSSGAAGSSSMSGQEMGTPTASGRTWRDWLLPKKLLQWSEGEEEHDESAMTSQDDLYLGHRQDDCQRASDLDQLGAAVAGSLAPNMHRRYSDTTNAASASGIGRQQRERQEFSRVQAGQVPGSISSSSAPCSPRTPAAKDSRQQQGEDGATIAAAGEAAVEPDSPDADLSQVPRQMMLSDVSTAAPVAPGGLAGSRLPGDLQSCNIAGRPAITQQQKFGVTACGGNAVATVQLDTCMNGQVLVDEIIRCMAQVYAADKDVADMTLGCLVDFVRRKLVPASSTEAGPGSTGDEDSAYFSSVSSRDSKDSSPAVSSMSNVAGAPAGAAASSSSSISSHPQLPAAAALLPADELQLVQQFFASPEAAYLSPEMMRATLCCLPATDLQMALAYVVRQHEDTMTQPGQSDSEADTSSQSVMAEDDAGCMPLFQLHHLDELSFEQLVEQIWPGELEEGPAAESAVTAAGVGKASAAGGGKGGKQQPQKSKQLPPVTHRDPRGAVSAGANVSDVKCVQDQPKLLPASWWVEHLQQAGRATDPPAAIAGDQRILRWVYGNIVSSQAEEFAAGQAALRCNLDRHSALLELYEGMANAWRRMQRVADKRRMLEHLRQNIKTRFAVVRSQEEAGEHCTGQQAVTFLEALFTSLCTSNNTNPAVSNPGSSDDGPSNSDLAAVATGAAPAVLAAGAWPGSVSLSPPPALCLTAPPPGASQLQPEPPGLASQAAPDAQAVAAATGAAAVAAAQNAAVSQLQVRLNQLAPLYLCEPAVEVVRSAPELAREASQRYARALLDRELAVLALIEAMLDDDVQAARQKLAGANERLLSRRAELSTAEAEHGRIVAEGPASHRKKDFLDKATKEAEHREKLADLKAKIDAAKAAIAEDEVTAAAADLAAADAQGDLARVREQARQIAARKKNLEDLNAQLSAPVPPLTEATLAAAVNSSAALVGAGLGMLPGPGAAAIAAAAAGHSGCSCCPVPAGMPALQQPTVTALSNAAGGSGAVGADPAAISTAAELGWSWRAQRLECLMYRVLWVAEAVKLFQSQYEPRGKQYELLVRASKWVKERCDEYDLTFQAAAEDLSNLRNRVQQLACVDLTFVINEAALKYIRKSVEAEAAQAQELRSQKLLLELAAEEEAKKAQQAALQQQQQQQATEQANSLHGGAANGSVANNTAASGGKSTKGRKAKQATGKDAQKQKQQQQQQLSEHEQKVQEAAARQALDAAKKAREEALERELEQRRRELEQLEAQREAELIKQAEEASLKEQQALKRAQEASMREQQALADAAAVLAAAAGSADVSLLKAGSSSAAGSSGSSMAATTATTRGQQQKPQKAANKAAGTASTSPAVGATPSNHAPQRSKGQQHAGAATPPPHAAVNKAASKAATTHRVASAAQNSNSSSAPGAAASRAGKAASGTAAGTKQQQRMAHQQQQQHARQSAAVTAGAGQTRKSGGKAASAFAVASHYGSGQAPQHAHQGSKQQQHHYPPPPVAPQHVQPPPQPALSLLDFGPTPAEAYAAAAAEKEQHSSSATRDQQQQQQQAMHQPPPPPPRRPSAEVHAAAGHKPAADEQGSKGAATDAADPHTAAQGVASTSATSAAPTTAATALSTSDEVVQMPAGGAGSSSHLSQLSLSHPMDTNEAGGTAVSLATASSGLGLAAGSGLAAVGLGHGGPGMSLQPLSVSLHSSSSTPVMPLLSAASSGSSFDPFGSSAYRPPDALLSAAGGGFGERQAAAVQQQQLSAPPERSAASLQSASSAPLNADLGMSAGALGRLGSHHAHAASVGSGSRPSLDLLAAAGSSSLDIGRHALPPRPSTACTNLPSQQHAAGAIGTAASSIASSIASDLGGFSTVEPGSPFMGSSPADAPHIQSIMSLLDGDAGPTALGTSTQQQQQSGSGRGSDSQNVSKHSGTLLSGRRPASAGAGMIELHDRQQQHRLIHSPSAGTSSNWDVQTAAAARRSSSGGSKRSSNAAGNGEQQQQVRLDTPPGLAPAVVSGTSRSGSAFSSSIPADLPPRPASASSSTGGESATSFPRQQLQQQGWVHQQQQLAGYGGATWGAMTPGMDAGWGAPAPAAGAAAAAGKDRKSGSGGQQQQAGPASGGAAGSGTVRRQGLPSSSSPVPFSAAVSVANAPGAATVRGGSPIGYVGQAAIANTAVSKARQQHVAAATSDQLVSAAALSESSGLGPYGFSTSRAGIGAVGALPGSNAAVGSGLGLYPGSMGVTMPGLGPMASPGVLSPHFDSRAAAFGPFSAGVMAGVASPPSSVGVGQAGGLFWGWQGVGNPHAAAAAAMAAAMHQQQGLASRGAGAPAGLPGMWQPMQQQQQHHGRVQQQPGR